MQSQGLLSQICAMSYTGAQVLLDWQDIIEECSGVIDDDDDDDGVPFDGYWGDSSLDFL